MFRYFVSSSPSQKHYLVASATDATKHLLKKIFSTLVDDKEEVSGLKKDLKQIKYIHAHTHIYIKRMDPCDNWHKNVLFKASVSAVCVSISRGGIKLRCMQWGGTRISALSDGAGQRGSSGKIEDTSLCRLLLTLTDRWTPHLFTLEAPVFMVLIKGPTDGRPVEIGCFHPVEMYNQEKVYDLQSINSHFWAWLYSYICVPEQHFSSVL